MGYKKLPELETLTDRRLAELQVEILERTRKNTGAIADMIGTIILLSLFASIFLAMSK